MRVQSCDGGQKLTAPRVTLLVVRASEEKMDFLDRRRQRGFTGAAAFLAATNRPLPVASTSTRAEPSAL